MGKRKKGYRKRNQVFSNHYRSDRVKSKQGVNTNYVDAFEVFQQRRRARTTKGRRDQIEHVAENTFMQTIPKTRVGLLDVRHTTEHGVEIEQILSNPAPRRFAQAKRRDEKVLDSRPAFAVEYWQGSLRMSGFNTWNSYTYLTTSEWNYRVFFSGARWVLVKEYKTFYKYSGEYKTQDALFIALNDDPFNTFWVGLKDKPELKEEPEPPQLDIVRKTLR